MSAELIDNKYALTIRSIHIEKLTDEEAIKEAIEYTPRKSIFRIRIERQEVASVLFIPQEDVPLTKVRSVIHRINSCDGGHWTVVPPTSGFSKIRIRRDS